MSKKQRLIALRQKLQSQSGIESYLSEFTEQLIEASVERVVPEAFHEPSVEPNHGKKQRLTGHQLRQRANAAIQEQIGVWVI